MKKVLLSFAFLMMTAVISKAQPVGNATVSETMTVTIRPVFDLALTSTANHTVDFNALVNYDNGVELSQAATLKYRANTDWRIMVSSDAASFTSTGGSTTMPADKLQVRLTGGTYLTNLSTTPQQLPGAAGTRGTADVKIDYNLVPGYNYDPANYTIGVKYTITNP